jgi:hypothetical protein
MLGRMRWSSPLAASTLYLWPVRAGQPFKGLRYIDQTLELSRAL